MIAAALWWLSCLPEALAFQRACHQVARCQERLLAHLLTRHAGSAFGRQHRFARLHGADEYRAAVPVRDYDEFSPWIERIAAGELRVLTEDRVRLLEPTSGTRALKLIPYTAGLKGDFQRGLAPWIADLFLARPRLFGGPSYWSLTPPPERSRRSSGGLPIGFEDDASYLGGVSAWLVRSMLIRPQFGSDYLDDTLRALLNCPELRLVSVWSPTLWLLLLERLRRDWQQWARQPELAKRLRSGRLDTVWPHLQCISCWGDASAETAYREVQALFPQVLVQPKGLLSTEAFVSLPLTGVAGGCVLSVRSHFFEFLDPRGQSWLAHEISPGPTYEVVCTTSGGLYRYRTGDLVQVTGFYRECPVLRFLGRRGGVSDRCGEKLGPDSLVLPRLPGPCFLAFENGAYVLYSPAPEFELREAAHDVERRLLEQYHYALCRRLGQLGPVRAYRLEAERAWECFYARLQSLGRRPGDVKPEPLRLESDWSRFLPGEFLL